VGPGRPIVITAMRGSCYLMVPSVCNFISHDDDDDDDDDYDENARRMKTAQGI